MSSAPETIADAAPPPAVAARGHSSAYAIYILILVTAANVLGYADRHLFAIVMPAIKAEFGATDGLLGVIAGPGFTLSYLLFTMPLARLADRWSRRRVLAISIALWSAATGACGLAANIVHLALGRVAVGIGEAGGMPPSQSLVSQLFGARRRSTALGVLASGSYLGLVVGLGGGGAIAATLGWRQAFLIMAVAGLPIALLVWLTGPRRTASAQPATAATASRGETMLATLRHCWSIPSLRLLALGTGVFNIFGYAASIWLPTLLIRSHGMTTAEAGFWLGVSATFGGVSGSFASGAIVDALTGRDKRWQLRVPALGFIVSFPILLAILTLPAGLTVNLVAFEMPLFALLMIVSSFLASFWMGPSFAAASHLVSVERRSQATAMLVVTINVVGSIVGPMIAGFVSDALTASQGEEALRYSLMSMSLLPVLGGMMVWRASGHYPRDLARQD